MLRIAVLGPMELCEGESGLPVPAPLPRALLGLLALRPGSAVPVDEIIDGLWGDAPPESARNLPCASCSPDTPWNASSAGETPRGPRLDRSARWTAGPELLLHR